MEELSPRAILRMTKVEICEVKLCDQGQPASKEWSCDSWVCLALGSGDSLPSCPQSFMQLGPELAQCLSKEVKCVLSVTVVNGAAGLPLSILLP